MKSLYELIKREHEIVEEIKKYEYDAYCYTRDIEWCEDYKLDCYAKVADIERFKALIADAELAIANSKIELDYAREDIRRYFEELNK